MVAIDRSARCPATCGANPSSRNADSFSATVWPRSEPATSAPYTGAGSRLRARRCATATDSNHGFCCQGFCSHFGFDMTDLSRARQ